MILSASLVKICICLSTSSDQSNQIQLSFVKQYIFKVQDLFFMRNNKNTFLVAKVTAKSYIKLHFIKIYFHFKDKITI